MALCVASVTGSLISQGPPHHMCLCDSKKKKRKERKKERKDKEKEKERNRNHLHPTQRPSPNGLFPSLGVQHGNEVFPLLEEGKRLGSWHDQDVWS